jgi:four helix bundle protein
MKERDLKLRTKAFALAVIKFWEKLPKDEIGKTLGRQLLRSGTSVAANYRAVCRAKSTPDFLSKFSNVLEEADESAFWIELLIDAGKVTNPDAEPLLQEANELVTVAVSSINTTRRNSTKT